MRLPMRFFPKKIRHSYYRSRASKLFKKHDDIIFKIANTQEELEAAFRLTYKVYLSENLILSNSSQMTLNKIHSLPTTKVLIAVRDSKVISAMTLSLESSIQSLCEVHFDVNVLRKNSLRFLEVSGFVVDPSCDVEFQSLLYPFCKLGIELNKLFFKADYIITALSAEDFDFWHAQFFLEKLTEKVERHEDIRNKSDVCAYVDITDFETKFARKYSKNNIYKYIFADEDTRFQIPNVTEIVREKYSASLLDYFFNQNSNLFATMSSFESRTLQKIYEGAKYDEVLPQITSKVSFENQRNAKRYHAHLTGNLRLEKAESSFVSVKTVSLLGLGAVCDHKLLASSTYEMTIDIGETDKIVLLVSPVWTGRDNTYGFSIRRNNPEWISFIESFYKIERRAS